MIWHYVTIMEVNSPFWYAYELWHLEHVCMFITPERIRHSKTSDIASLMRTAFRAIQLIKYTQTIRDVTSSVSFKLKSVKEEVTRKKMYRDIIMVNLIGTC